MLTHGTGDNSKMLFLLLNYCGLSFYLVYRNSAGFVFLRFENTQAAISAQRALHGRWFAGKMITATFMVLMLLIQIYNFKSFGIQMLTSFKIVWICSCPRTTRLNSRIADRVLDSRFWIHC